MRGAGGEDIREHYERTWISPGEHSIRIVVRLEKGMLSQGHTVYLDAFQVTGQQ